jgi:hypothetical protein
VLVDLLSFAVELWVFMIAFVIFLDGIGILVRLLCLMLYWCINFTDMLCILGFGIFKIIAVSIGGFLMPTACGFSVSPCGQYRYRCLDCTEIGLPIILSRTVFVTFPCSGCATMVVMLACLQISICFHCDILCPPVRYRFLLLDSLGFYGNG